MAIQESGFYYPNKMGRIYITSIEETIGREAIKAVLKLAGVPSDYYPPPNNFAKEFDFAYFGAIGTALEVMYGLHAERGLGLHAGRASFAAGLAEFGTMVGISDLTFKAIPLKAKLKVGFKGMAEIYSKFSDQLTSVEDAGEGFVYTVHRCPVCWGRTSNKPICYGAIGMLEEGIRWVNDGKMLPVEEVACHAAGDESCVFHIQKEPLS